MASAFSNILSLLSLGSGGIKENEDFGLEVTEDGIQTTGDRYKQSGLGRFISRVGGDKTADDMNRAFENALMKAEMDMKIQQMQNRSQAQSAQDLARLNNSLMGQRELEAFTRNRGATVEDRDLANQRAIEAELRRFDLEQKGAEADLDRLPFVQAAKEGLTREEATHPAYRYLKQQVAKSGLDLENIKNLSGVRNQADLNREGKRLVNIRGLGTIPLSAAQGLGAGALNLYENPADQELRRQLLQAQIARQQALAEPEPSLVDQMNALQGLGSNRPISGRAGGKTFRFDGDDLILLNERE